LVVVLVDSRIRPSFEIGSFALRSLWALVSFDFFQLIFWLVLPPYLLTVYCDRTSNADIKGLNKRFLQSAVTLLNYFLVTSPDLKPYLIITDTTP